MNAMVLRLNKAGVPASWLRLEEAAVLYCRERVLWTLGEARLRLRGGINRHGERSVLDIAPIIACEGRVREASFAPALSNRLLFRRDGHLCLYCGERFAPRELTRDHVRPRVQGGADCWTNVVTACRRCNQHKAGRTPEQAGMTLLAVPFEPNRFEWLWLANHSVLADQMEFLRDRFTPRLTGAA